MPKPVVSITHTMSNKGQNQTLATKLKIGLSNEKDRTELHAKVWEYISALKITDFPSITRCAIYAGISEKALLAYELRTAENSDIRILLDMIRDLQKASLMEGGLKKSFDGRMATFLLQANHSMNNEAPTLNQTNNFNVSPEILAEALELSRTKKPALPDKK